MAQRRETATRLGYLRNPRGRANRWDPRHLFVFACLAILRIVYRQLKKKLLESTLGRQENQIYLSFADNGEPAERRNFDLPQISISHPGNW